jgi:hypothetical protein
MRNAAATWMSLSQRAVRWSRRKILEAAAHDIVITERLSRVANFIDPHNAYSNRRFWHALPHTTPAAP